MSLTPDLALAIDDDYDSDYDKDLLDDEDCDAEESQGYDVIPYTVPEWALPYLFNGDATGLDGSESGDEDLQAIASFLKSENLDQTKGHWNYDSEKEEAYFSRRNDITNLGDNVVDIEWVIMKE